MILKKKDNSMSNNKNLNLQENYKEIFRISEEDYQKEPEHYNTYLEFFKISEEDYQKEPEHYNTSLRIFYNLVENKKDIGELKKDIENNNPWQGSNSSNNEYKFKSLAFSDYKILERLLIDNIEELNQNGKTEAKLIIESRFNDFEHAFDGNFINPQVILLGINPKMTSNHDSYGLEDTVYRFPFDKNRHVLNHPEDDFNKDYYFRKKRGFFYTNNVPENIRKEHIKLSTQDNSVTPFALLEVFPYASEKEKEWQKGYKISSSLSPYFKLEKILPSQIWLVCLLTYAIKNTNSLFLYLRINNAMFRKNFLIPYFNLLRLESSDTIKVLTKKSNRSQIFSKNNIKPYFKENKMKVRTNSETAFFEDVWCISLDNN